MKKSEINKPNSDMFKKRRENTAKKYVSVLNL